MSLYDAIVDFFTTNSAFKISLFITACLAIIEMIAFGLAVLFTMWNVAVNPDPSTRVKYILLSSTLFVICRCIPLPFVLSALDISEVTSSDTMPYISKACIVVMGIWMNLTISLPCLTIWYSRARYGIGNNQMTPTKKKYKFIVILPVYNETYKLLVKGLQSIVDQNYPKDKIAIHVSFDSDERSKLYVDLLEYLSTNDDNVTNAFTRAQNLNMDVTTVSGQFQGIETHVHKFPHGGKRMTQAKTYEYIQRNCHIIDEDHTIYVFLDSDNYTYDNAFHNLAYNFERNKMKKAFAGYMTAMSSGRNACNPWHVIQDVEYVSGEMNRSFELLMGTVNCLPGGFTAVKASVMKHRNGALDASVAEKYFGDLPNYTITDFHRNYLGEDRYLTHLLHFSLPRHSLGFCPSARAKTDPPSTFMGLLRQRRRWLLGAISNEMYMITDEVIWKKFTFMNAFKTFQLSFKCNFFCQLVMAMLAIYYVDPHSIHSILLLSLSAGIPLVLNWFAACATAHKLGHWKVFILQPFMLIICTLSQIFIDYYTLMTFNTRSWGGARMTSKVVSVPQSDVESQ